MSPGDGTVRPDGTVTGAEGTDLVPFLQACRREATRHTPVWLMRQAGRYLPEYRQIRSRLGFLELCKNPEAATEVTLLPVDRLKVDAAILFADILLVVEPMGVGLEFSKGDGPVIHRPVRTGVDVDRLRDVPVEESVPFVFETVRQVRRALDARRPRVPLIGFAGAPFTLASYLIEGGASRNYLYAKRLMHGDPGVWHALMAKLARTVSAYVRGQIAAGAEAVQLFDSWVGTLAPDDYRELVLPHTRALIQALPPGVPVIHFGTGTAGLLPLMKEAGGDVIGLDWRVDLGETWDRLGSDIAVQGNLDPVALLDKPAEFRPRVQAILDGARRRPGHIFNLGHGVLPETPVEHAVALVDMVHELSAR